MTSAATRALGLAALLSATFAAVHYTPSPSAATALHPAMSAALGTPLVALWLVAAPGTRLHRVSWERRLMALFLALMPVVYLNSLLATRFGLVPSEPAQAVIAPGWLWVELAGLPVFFGLALVGLRRAPRVLGWGIVAHGLLWDAWHVGRAPFMPDWYALACLLVDLGWGFWALTRASVWEAGDDALAPPDAGR